MYLNDLWIADGAVERVTVTRPTLELRIAWRWEDVPLLFDLPSQLTLHWDHIHQDDPHACVSVELVGWNARRSTAPLLSVTLQLTRAEVQGRRKGTPSSEWARDSDRAIRFP